MVKEEKTVKLEIYTRGLPHKVIKTIIESATRVYGSVTFTYKSGYCNAIEVECDDFILGEKINQKEALENLEDEIQNEISRLAKLYGDLKILGVVA